MKLFLDTNVFLRFFVQDDPEMAAHAKKILTKAETGRVRVATSTIVLMEIMYTLKTYYKQDRKGIAEHVESVLDIKNLLLVEETDFSKAFSCYQKRGEKIADCLIINQVPDSYRLCSFDGELEELIGGERFVHPSAVM